ncbi:spherulation-specific family 4 protein [Streptomyces sp. NPDC008001]|uniref:spherulation-specific family 4 protein n=1 Tax=Streptomyces sp. NPDC008001 TaxID=3364804 RepID=UPI0036EE808F
MTPPGPPGGGRLLVPLYVHPAADPAAWAALAGAAPRLRGVVLNAADGPGQRPDPAFGAAADRLRAAGVPLLGYVDTGYGRRAPRAVVADIRRHRRWYSVDGVFLDQVPVTAAPLPHYRRLVLLAKALGAGTAVLNPGTHPHPGYARIADLLVTFEGDWETYRRAAIPPWTADHPPARFCHLVYGVPPGGAAHVARTADGRGAGVHCAVPGEGTNPWRSLPYLNEDPSRPGGLGPGKGDAGDEPVAGRPVPGESWRGAGDGVLPADGGPHGPALSSGRASSHGWGPFRRGAPSFRARTCAEPLPGRAR